MQDWMIVGEFCRWMLKVKGEVDDEEGRRVEVLKTCDPD